MQRPLKQVGIAADAAIVGYASLGTVAIITAVFSGSLVDATLAGVCSWALVDAVRTWQQVDQRLRQIALAEAVLALSDAAADWIASLERRT